MTFRFPETCHTGHRPLTSSGLIPGTVAREPDPARDGPRGLPAPRARKDRAQRPVGRRRLPPTGGWLRQADGVRAGTTQHSRCHCRTTVEGQSGHGLQHVLRHQVEGKKSPTRHVGKQGHGADGSVACRQWAAGRPAAGAWAARRGPTIPRKTQVQLQPQAPHAPTRRDNAQLPALQWHRPLWSERDVPAARPGNAAGATQGSSADPPHCFPEGKRTEATTLPREGDRGDRGHHAPQERG